jgi:predicted RNA-binding Zn-ribbon protein involved in translation (DUF1610 family)
VIVDFLVRRGNHLVMPRWNFMSRKHPMNVTLAGIEELEMFPSPEEREKAIAQHADSIKGWDLALGIGVCVIIGAGSWVLARWGILGGLSYLTSSPIPGWVQELVILGTVAVCMFLTLRFLHRWGVKRELRHRLVTLGVPVCVGCGYLLRGLEPNVEKCPECGRTVDQVVREMLTKAAQDAQSPS